MQSCVPAGAVGELKDRSFLRCVPVGAVGEAEDHSFQAEDLSCAAFLLEPPVRPKIVLVVIVVFSNYDDTMMNCMTCYDELMNF